MKALVLGATGLVGHALWRDWNRRSGWTVHGTYAKRALPDFIKLDLRDRAEVESVFWKFKPDLVALTSSNPNVDYCETHAEETRALNVAATVEAAKIAKGTGAKLIYFSTDYVFDGSKAPYREDFPVSPISEYGRQKVEAENRVLDECPTALILRISGVFGWALNRLNFVMQVLDRQAKGEPISAAGDIISKPTYADWLALVIPELVERKAVGILNACGADEMSRYDLATQIAKVFSFNSAPIRKISRLELKQPAPRPPHSSLDTARLASLIRTQVWTTEQSLKHMKDTQTAWDSYVGTLGALK